MTNIPIEKFGKDHWSLLVYIETRAVAADDLGKSEGKRECAEVKRTINEEGEEWKR